MGLRLTAVGLERALGICRAGVVGGGGGTRAVVGALLHSGV